MLAFRKMLRAPYRIGMFGLGHVGGALARRLVDDADAIARAANRPIRLEAIVVARPQGRVAPAPLMTAEELIARPSLDAVVELVGGLEPAHTYIKNALSAGLEVITANKQVVATQGPALARLGRLRFEASVASAIPIVETLADTLASDRIRSIIGILNGPTNSMLGEIAGGASYAEALADAPRPGCGSQRGACGSCTSGKGRAGVRRVAAGQLGGAAGGDGGAPRPQEPVSCSLMIAGVACPSR